MAASELDPWKLFLNAMRSPVTRDRYSTRVAKFFEFMEKMGQALKPFEVDYVNGKAQTHSNNAAARILIETDDKVYEGSRNPNLYAYACSVLMKQWSKKPTAQIKEIFIDANQTRCVPPLGLQEVQQIWNSALKSVSDQMIKNSEITSNINRGSAGNSGPQEQSKSKDKRQEQEQKVIYPQKYSGIGIIAEAIMIGKDPYFLVSENGITILRKQIIDADRTIRPFTPEMYINRPYTFESINQVQQLVAETKNETLDTLYRLIKAIWKKYIDADNFHITICAADTIFTYFQDKIGLTHYLFFVGNAGSGKSNNLTVFQFLAYRNMTNTGLSNANIYQFLGSGDEGIGTICEDEADNIDEDK